MTGLDYWNISWSYGIVYKSAGEPLRPIIWSCEIVHKGAGGPIWTVGTSTRVMESSIKVIEDHLDDCKICWSSLNLYKRAGTSSRVMQSSINGLENHFGLLEHHLDL